MTMQPGHVLGDRYRLERRLPGTDGRPVWTAFDEWAEVDVTLALVPGSTGDGEDARRIRRTVGQEVRVATNMRSPHVREVLDVVSDEHGLWVAARTRAGSRSLAESLATTPAPTPARLARWGRDAAAGLADLHAAGLVHRHVDAALIAVDDDGSASLLGAATTGDLAAGDAAAGDLAAGDLAAGDEAGGNAGDDPAADDVRALGALLGAALAATRSEVPDATDEDRREVDSLAAVLDLAADGGTDASEFRRALSELLESQPTSMPAAPSAPVEQEESTVRVQRDTPTAPGEEETTRLPPAAPPGSRSPRQSGPAPWRAAPTGAPGGPPMPYAASRPSPTGPVPARAPQGGAPPAGPPLDGRPTGPGSSAPDESTSRSARTRGRNWVARHRVLVAGGAAAVALLVVAGLLLAGLDAMGPRDDTISPAAQPTSVPTPAPVTAAPVSSIGDRRTVNPCSLLSTTAFTGSGSPILFEDFGPYASCAVLTATAQGGSYVTSASFYAPEEFVATNPTERVGDVAVTRLPAASAERCRRLLALPDGVTVKVETVAVTAAAGVDPCALADAGTSTALPVLAGRSITRRAVDPSLQFGSQDACALLDPTTLGQVPGLDTTRTVTWFGNWGCSVGFNRAFANAPYANVSFDRSAPLSGTPSRIGRHSAVVTPVPAGSGQSAACQISLIQRSYTGTSGRARVEIVRLSLYGAQGDPCAAATSLAAATEGRLPAPA